MSVSIVKYSDFCEEMRFDAEYYKQEYLNTERKVEKNSHCTILNTVAKKSKKKFNPLPNPTGEFNYIEIENIDLSNGKYDYSTLKNYEAPSRARKSLDYEDVLISTVRPNRNAIAIFLHKGNNFVCSTGFAVIKSHKINPFYLFVFLKTSSSINQLVRKTSAAMYPAVSEDDIMSMKVILPDEKIQKGIELKIKLALNKEKQSDDKFNKAEQKLFEILGIKKLRIPDKKTNIISFSNYRKTLRLDSRFYLLKYENAIEAIKNSGYKIKTVSEIISEPLKSGATPLAGTNAYIGKEKGIPFYRIVDIKNFELAKEKILYIRPDIHNGALKRSKIKYGDILFSIAGTIGICVVVPETLKEGNINQALAIIRLKKEYNPYFIALFFNSYIGRLISEKISRPVVQANLNLSELALLPIPQIPENIQNKIANLVREALQFRQESRNLIKESIKQVENIV